MLEVIWTLSSIIYSCSYSSTHAYNLHAHVRTLGVCTRAQFVVANTYSTDIVYTANVLKEKKGDCFNKAIF